jgi:hypothetical protein
MGVKFMLSCNAFMNIWCIEARLMGINRNVDELAFFKLIHGQKGV